MLRATKLYLALIPLAAIAALCPLLIHGVSCGQDMPFHLQSWLDAAAQLRHGHYPQWAFTPAWNAGEPRFIFYPPLSWLLGALLTALLPISAAPIAYIFLALTASGFAMHHLAKHYVSPPAALLASAFYLANPYMLFCAFERTAFAELLAAAWIPLLFLAVFRPQPTIRGVAVPIALLWLTNAPAAVMGCYTFALIATLRVASRLVDDFSSRPKARSTVVESGVPGKRSRLAGVQRPASSNGLSTLRLALTFTLGTLLGLALPAFYLIPAAHQRRFVQVAMAIIPNMRYQDNFLFTHTTDTPHNIVNHTASTLAITVLALTVVAISVLILTRTKSVISTEAQRSGETPVFVSAPKLVLALLTTLIAFLLIPLSSPIWEHLPNLAYLQFPWRLLTILSAILAFTIALLLNKLRLTSSLSSILYPLSPALVLALSFTAYNLCAQACDRPSLPTSIGTLFRTGHGAPPTDEYTPNNADNDLLRTDNPGYWLAATPNAPAPNTTPTFGELHPTLPTDDVNIPDSQTLSTPATHHITISTAAPSYVIFNLRDYPNWQVTTGCPTCIFFRQFEHLQRDDGLIAIAVPPGTFTIDITWHRTLDQTLGLITSTIALIALALTFRKPSPWAPDTFAHCAPLANFA
jgi:hypothetical protein